MTFGYDADVVRPIKLVSRATLAQHAENLYTALRNERTSVSPSRPIIFIAHSLGGTVTKDALLQSHRSNDASTKAVSDHTCGVLFMGAPHFGSSDADTGYFFAYLFGLMHQSNTSSLEDLKKETPSLDNLERNFSQMLAKRLAEKKPLDVACFCEELPVDGIVGLAKGTRKLVSRDCCASRRWF